MRLVNDRTGEAVGDLADISFQGFKLESQAPITLNTVINFRMDVPADVSDKPSIVFTARSRWCKPDAFDTRLYDVGFEIVRMDPNDAKAFALVFERYGRAGSGAGASADYLWKK